MRTLLTLCLVVALVGLTAADVFAEYTSSPPGGKLWVSSDGSGCPTSSQCNDSKYDITSTPLSNQYTLSFDIDAICDLCCPDPARKTYVGYDMTVTVQLGTASNSFQFSGACCVDCPPAPAGCVGAFSQTFLGLRPSGVTLSNVTVFCGCCNNQGTGAHGTPNEHEIQDGDPDPDNDIPLEELPNGDR